MFRFRCRTLHPEVIDLRVLESFQTVADSGMVT
jgi:hypothetical protein